MATTTGGHTGAMVALFVPAEVGADLAVDGGEPAGDLHITLAYLGDTAEAAFTEADLVAAVTPVATDTAPLEGTVSGAGRFTGADGTDPIWLAADVVGLDELRVAVCSALEAAGIPVDDTHGFQPHITVAYVAAGDPSPLPDPPPSAELRFPELTVTWAENRTQLPFGGAMSPKPTREAFPGGRTYGDVRSLLEQQLTERLGDEDHWVWVRDLTDTTVIYDVEDRETYVSCTHQVDFTLADDGTVTFGTPVEVERRTVYEPKPAETNPLAAPAAKAPMPATAPAQVTEGAVQVTDSLPGRILESKGPDSDGGRVFRVQILEYGTSKNGVRYTEAVMAPAAARYEGAKAFDRHRTDAELATSSISGLVGGYRAVEATATGLEADLHLLPSATHTAEALEASIAAQAQGLPPLVGLSHDVVCFKRHVVEGGRRIQEAVAVAHVNSVDVVADPSAGGRATRLVAGGLGADPNNLPEETDMTTLAELLAGASDEEKAELRSLLGDGTTTTTSEPTAVTEAIGRDTTMGRLLVERAIADAELNPRLTESIRTQLGERFTEADLTQAIATAKTFGEQFEVAGLAPRVGHAQVTRESHDKKVERLDRTLEGKADGYPSLRAAYADIAGLSGLDLLDGELPFEILRESAQGPVEGRRVRESVDSSTWGSVLADALHRRLVAEYNGVGYTEWRDLVSSIVPRTDFRTNHVTRLGGYGALPAVAEGDSYDPLTSPGDEESSYALTKRGGTEDLTLETIANDDIGAVRRIPRALGRAAAMTLYKFVVDTLFQANPTCGYDSTALFASGHANTTAMALSDANLAVARRKMRKQAAFGVSADVLGIVPKFLWVPPELEELAFQLCTSAVAVTSTGDATIPNLHARMEPRVVDHWTDPTDWFVTADPNTVETIEVGFYNGRQDPELFVQDDPKVGAAFTNDKVTWKIRHIYSGTVVDHRGFQRGTVVDS